MELNEVISNLEKKGYIVSYYKTAEEAADAIDGSVDGTTVGMGGSVTIDELGLAEKLKKHNTVYWHQHLQPGDDANAIRAAANGADVYLSSVNAIAETGEIVNIDGTCNRVSAMLYGHKRVIFVAGINKLAEDEEKAIARARNIAAPKNAKRLHRNTPCAVNADRCYNCKSPERICRALSVFWEKPSNGIRYEIVLVGETLGY